MKKFKTASYLCAKLLKNTYNRKSSLIFLCRYFTFNIPAILIRLHFIVFSAQETTLNQRLTAYLKRYQDNKWIHKEYYC